jgi:hypothetical protein
MPLDIGHAEIANRLRRLLRIRGRIPTRLDENVIPTVAIGSSDRPPWRQSPVIFADMNTAGAVAAENSAIAATLPASDLGVMVIWRIWADGVGNAASANVSLIMHSHAALLAELSDFSPQLRRYENLDPALIISNTAQASGVHMLVGSIPSASYPLLGAEIDRARLPGAAVGSETRVVFQGPYVIPAGGGLYIARTSANESLTAGFYGEYYPDVPASQLA